MRPIILGPHCPAAGPGGPWYRGAMLLAPRHGFVFLAMPRAASSSVERAFKPYAQLMQASRTPELKHTSYAEFQRFLEPWLEAKGFPRGSYEVVCAFREPIDWLGSWWRYRSRDVLADPSHWNHKNYAGGVSFEEFARAYMDHGAQFARIEDPAGVRRPSEFVRPDAGGAPIDRVFRQDRLDLLVDFLRGKVGEEVEVGARNAAPERSFSLSGACERELREFFAPEYGIYERAIGG